MKKNITIFTCLFLSSLTFAGTPCHKEANEPVSNEEVIEESKASPCSSNKQRIKEAASSAELDTKSKRTHPPGY